MAGLTISQVARQVGLRASAIRYYEQIGILRPAHRISGQRRYDTTILYRLAIIQRARQIGFTLDEIRQLFFGFRDRIPASERWRKLCGRKLVELQTLVDHIQSMQDVLRRLENCSCTALDQCGKGMFERHCASVSTKRIRVP
jgi:MerR family redox-sensitive transcriptional activator SoxR